MLWEHIESAHEGRQIFQRAFNQTDEGEKEEIDSITAS